MASSFPTSIDNFTDPLATSPLNSPSHSLQHSNLNDAVEKIETYMGLVFVKSQTIGSAVSSVTVSDAFSATYDNYLIQVSGGAVSTQNELRLQMSGTTSGYYYQLIIGTWSATITGEGSKIATEWLYTGMGATNGLVMNCQVYLPYLATRTRIVAPYFGFVGDVGHVHGQLDNATQYTGFVIKTSTGTMTGGTIRVYGYRNS